jgi:L-fucose isomerase-like protein
MPPRIGLLVVGHPDYPNDIGLSFAAVAADELRRRGVEVTAPQEATLDPIRARDRGAELAGAGLDGVIVWLGTWIEASTAVAAIREFEHLPLALWGFNMYELDGKRESTGSFVAAAVLKGSLERMGYRPRTLLGLPTDEAALAGAETFARAAAAARRLRQTRLGLVGYASMSMYPGTCDHALLRRYVGPEIVHVDTYSLVRRAEAQSPEAVQTLAEALRAAAQVSVLPERLLKAARLTGGLAELARDLHLDALNVKCQYELSQEWGMTACVPLSWLSDQGLICACEGDVMASVTQCVLHHLTDQVVTYGDILDLQEDRMLLSSCGMAPLCLAHAEPPPRICELGYPGFDGIICSCTLRRGKVTFARLVEEVGSYRLVYGTGEGVDTELRQGRFPALQVRLDGSPQRLLETLASQHFALCWGDVGAGLEEIGRLLGWEVERV